MEFVIAILVIVAVVGGIVFLRKKADKPVATPSEGGGGYGSRNRDENVNEH